MTQNERITQYLSTGRSITPAEARSRFGVRNLRARVNDLRTRGFCIYTSRNTKGNTSYRLGNPSREMVAAAYTLTGSALFTA